jgi:hypothetical protein
MIIYVKHSSYKITYDYFHSQQELGYPTKYIVNTTGCTLDNCVPIGLQTINATGRGNFIVPTNYESPFCGKFIQIYIQDLRHEEEFTPVLTLHEGSVLFPICLNVI